MCTNGVILELFQNHGFDVSSTLQAQNNKLVNSLTLLLTKHVVIIIRNNELLIALNQRDNNPVF